MSKPGKIEIKRGPEFLPSTSMHYLKRCRRNEPSPRVRERLLACMHRKDGMAVRQIAVLLKRSYSTVYGWLARVQTEGIGRRHDHAPPGRSCLLADAQTRELVSDLDAGPERCGFESSLWDSRLVRIHIKRKFGVEYTKTGAAALLRGLGFSWRKARPRNPKSASKRRQREFAEAASSLAAEKAAQGYTVMASDSASIELAQNRPGYGWRRRGRRASSPSTLSRQRRHIFGVLAADTFYFMFYDRADSDSFCDFLGRVHKRFGRILLFVDNASYHKSKRVMELVDSYNGDIMLEYLPPYTPELNPIEVEWRVIRRALSAKVFGTLEEMERSVRAMVRRKEILPVKMAGYLMV